MPAAPPPLRQCLYALKVQARGYRAGRFLAALLLLLSGFAAATQAQAQAVPTLSRLSSSFPSVTEGETLIVRLRLSGPLTEPVEVRVRKVGKVSDNLDASDFVDGLPFDKVLVTFQPAGADTNPCPSNGECIRELLIATVDDDKYEGNRNFRFNVSTNHAIDKVLINFTDVSANIIDNDPAPPAPPELSITATSYPIEEGETLIVTVQLETPPTEPIEVGIEEAGFNSTEPEDFVDGSPFDKTLVTLTPASSGLEDSCPSEGVCEKTIEIATADDDVYEGDEDFTFELHTDQTSLARVRQNNRGQVRISDNDPPPPELSIEVTDYPVTEGATLTVTVQLNSPPTGPVKVGIHHANNSTSAEDFVDGFPFGKILVTFQPPDAAISLTPCPDSGVCKREIEIETVDDTIVEGDEGFSFRLYTTAQVGVRPNNRGHVSIEDNEILAPVAVVVPHLVGFPGNVVSLDGSRSYDTNDRYADNPGLTYQWISQDSLALTNGNRARASFTVPGDSQFGDELVFKLTVTDIENLTDEATVTVTVSEAGEELAFSERVDDMSFAVGARVEFVLPRATGGDFARVLPEYRFYGYVLENPHTLPPGLTYDPETRTISGTTTEAFTSQTYTYTALISTPQRRSEGIIDPRPLQSIIVERTSLRFAIAVGNDIPTVDSITGHENAVNEGDTVTLTATADDPDGDNTRLTYAWSAPRDVDLNGADTSQVTFVAPTNLLEDRVLTVTLVVTDEDDNSTGPKTVAVTVIGEEDPPFVTLEENLTIGDGETVTLTATANDDEDGAVLSYEWTEPAVGSLSARNVLQPTFTAPELTADQAETLTLTVTNTGDAKSTTATVTISITAENDPPTVNIDSPDSVEEGETVPFAAVATDPDGDDDRLVYAWTKPAIGTLSDLSVAQPTFTAPELTANQVLTLTLEVTDEDGATSGQIMATITVMADDDPPTIERFEGPSTITGGETLTLIAVANDPDGDNDELSYNWRGSNVPRNAPDSPTLTIVTQPRDNNLLIVVRLQVTDEGGSSTEESTFFVSVTPEQEPPTVTVEENWNVNDGDTVLLTATADDPDGNNAALTYAWSEPAVGTLSNRNVLQPMFTAPELTADQVVTLMLEVTDEGSLTVTSTVKITVTAEDDPPIVDVQESWTLDEGETVSLTATATDDRDDSAALTYAWSEPAAGTLSERTVAQPTFTAPVDLVADEVVTLMLTVTDTGSLSTTSTVTITVTAENDPPVVTVEETWYVVEGETETLTAMAEDPEDEVLSYAWTPPAAGTLSARTVAQPTFTAPMDLAADQVLTLMLVVTDASGFASDTATVTITVLAAGLPVVKSRTAERVEEGESASFVLSLEAPFFPVGTPEDVRTFTLQILDDSVGNNAVQDDLAQTSDLTVVFPVGKKTHRFEVATLDDDIAEPLETLTLAIHGSQATVDIVDNEPYVVSFDPASVQIAEGGQQVVNINLDRPFSGRSSNSRLPATAQFIVEGGTATADYLADYQTWDITFADGDLSAPLTFTDGQQSVSVTLLAVVDGRDEAAETTRLALGGNDLLSDDELPITIEASGTSPPSTPNAIPIAIAGAVEEEVVSGSEVTLDGSGSHDDGTAGGTVEGYRWTRTGGTGSSSVAFSGTTSRESQMPTFTADTLAPGALAVTHVFSLVVVDNDGAYSLADEVTITVTSPNKRPVAVAHALTTTVASGSTVTLDASRSSDDDGTVEGYSWERTVGTGSPSLVLTSSLSVAPTFTADTLNPGDASVAHVFRLVVTDDDGEESLWNEVIITVTADTSAPSAAPTANADVIGGSNEVASGSLVTLDGSGSRASDGTSQPDGYSWTRTGGTGSRSLTLSNRAVQQPTFTADTLAPGDDEVTHVFRLEVTDGGVESLGSLVTITVTAPPVSNSPPTANAGPDQPAVPSGSQVTLDGSGSSDDKQIPANGYVWTQTDLGSSTVSVTFLTNENTAMPTFEAETRPAGGSSVTYVFSLVVTDSDGVQSTNPAVVTVTVTAPPRKPTLRTASSAIYTLTEGETVSVTVTLTRPPTQNIMVKLEKPLGSATAADFKPNQFDNVLVTFTPPGSPSDPCPNTGNCERKIVIEALDDDIIEDAFESGFIKLYTDQSELVNYGNRQFRVRIEDNDTPPVADAGPDQPAVSSGSQVTLDGSGSSDDKLIPENGYEWTQTDRGSSTVSVTFLTNENTAMPTFEAETLTVGADSVTHVFSLVVTDSDGLRSTNEAFVTVTVTAPVPPDLTLEGAPFTVTEGETLSVTLRLSGPPLRDTPVLLVRSGGTANAADFNFDFSEPAWTFTTSYCPAEDACEKVIAIPTVVDEMDETDKTAVLFLHVGDADLTNLAGVFYSVTITNKDAPPKPELSTSNTAYTLTEGETVTVTVTLSSAPAQNIEVGIRKAPGGQAVPADFKPDQFDNPLVTFTPPDSSTDPCPSAGACERKIVIEAVDDGMPEPSQNTFVALYTNQEDLVDYGDRGFRVVIEDNEDPPVLTRKGGATLSITEGESLNVTLQLSKPPVQPGIGVTVQLDTEAASSTSAEDFVGGSPFDKILSGFEPLDCPLSGVCEKVLVIETVDDDVYEGDEVFKFNLATHPQAIVTNNADPVNVVIEDNDPNLLLTESAYTVGEGGTLIATVRLLVPPTEDIEVGLQFTADSATEADFADDQFGDDGVKVTFTDDACPDTGACELEIEIATNDDRIVEGPESGFIQVTTQSTLVVVSDETSTVEIEDNETLSLTQTSYTGSEGTTLVAAARVGSPPIGNITVKLAFTPGTAAAADFAANQFDSALVTFKPPPPGTGNVPPGECPRTGPCVKGIAVVIADDDLVEGFETAAIRVYSDQANVDDLVHVNPESSALQITDNEKLSLDKTNYSVVEGTTLTVTAQLRVSNPTEESEIELVRDIGAGLRFTGASATADDFDPNQFDSILATLTQADCTGGVCGVTMKIATDDNDRTETEGDLVALITPYADLPGLPRATGANVTITDDETVPADIRPTARAGPNRVAEVGMRVTLDGSASNDPHQSGAGIGLEYIWTAPDGVTLTLNEPTVEGEPRGDKPTFVVPNGRAGQTLTITLEVEAVTMTLANGDKRKSLASTVLVTVRANAGDPVFGDTIINDQIWLIGDAQNLALPQADVPDDPDTEFEENTYDNRSDYYTYELSPALPDGLTFGATARTITGTPTRAAARQTYTYRAVRYVKCTFSDATDCVDDEYTLEFDILVGDGSPIVEASVRGPATVGKGVTVTLEGSAAPFDPSRAELLPPVWTASDANVSPTVSDDDDYMATFVAPVYAAEQVLTITLAVDDEDGASAMATVLVTVRANQPPTVNAEVDGGVATVAEGVTVTLTGSADDPTGDALQPPVWTSSDVSLTEVAGAEYRRTFVAPEQLVNDKVLNITLAVADVHSASATDIVRVTVTAGPNDPPVAAPKVVDSADSTILVDTATVNEGETVTLDSSRSSDPEGEDLIRRTWTSLTGVTLSSRRVVAPTFTAPDKIVEDKELEFRLVVRDARGRDSAPATVTVTVNGVNDPPIARAIVAIGSTVNEGRLAVLNGSASSDPDGDNDNLKYKWTAPPGVELSSRTTKVTRLTAPNLSADQVLAVTLVVTDELDLASVNTDNTVLITVTAENDAPIADAGPTQNVAEGETVTLDGTASSDRDIDHEVLTYSWTSDDLDEPLTGANPTFTAPALAAGQESRVLTITLDVADELEEPSVNDDNTVKITVHQARRVTVESRTSTQGADERGRVEEGEAAEFGLELVEGQVFPDGTPPEERTFILAILDESGIDNADEADLAQPSELTVVFPVGVRRTSFEVATADDSEVEQLERLTLDPPDSQSAEDRASVDIADNEPYTVSFDPDPVQITEGGEQVVDIMLDRPYHDKISSSSLQASAQFDGDEGTATVDDSAARDISFSDGGASVPVIFLDGEQSKSVTLAAVADAVDEAAETARLVLDIALNPLGMPITDTVLNANTLTITIANQALPTADAGTDQQVPSGSVVTLDGRESETSDGSPIDDDGYRWERDGGTGSSVSLNNENSAMPTFTAETLTPGDDEVTYEFRLKVTEGELQSLESRVTITVTAPASGPNVAPTANAGPDQFVSGGVMVTLDGRESNDPDGDNDALTYSWTSDDVTLTAEDTPRPTFTAADDPAEDMVLTVTLSVTDELLASSTNEATVEITVLRERLPTVRSETSGRIWEDEFAHFSLVLADGVPVFPADTPETLRTFTLEILDENGVNNAEAADLDPASAPTVVLPVGKSNTRFTVQTEDDDIPESLEKLTFGLNGSQAFVEIADNEAYTVTFTPSDELQIDEGEMLAVGIMLDRPYHSKSLVGSLSASAVLDEEEAGTAKTAFADFGNFDIQFTDTAFGTTAVNFGQGEDSSEVVLLATTDKEPEEEETTTLALTATSGGTLNTNELPIKITNVDSSGPPTVGLTDPSYTVDEGATLTATLRLSHAAEGDVVVTFSPETSADDPAYTATPADIDIEDPPQVLTTFDDICTLYPCNLTITVATKEDTVVEGDETFLLGFTTTDNAVVGQQSTVTITDNDGLELELTDASYSVAEGETLTVTARLDSPPPSDIEVGLEFTEDSAAEADFADNQFGDEGVKVTFTDDACPDTGACELEIVIETNDDRIVEGPGHESGSIQVTTQSSLATVTGDPATVEIEDNETLSLNQTGYSVTEGKVLIATARLGSPPTTGTVTVKLDFDAGTATEEDFADGQVDGDRTLATFSPADLVSEACPSTGPCLKAVRITVQDDALVEGFESASIRLYTEQTDLAYSNPESSALQIMDNEILKFSETNYSVAEGEPLTLTVRLENPAEKNEVDLVHDFAVGLQFSGRSANIDDFDRSKFNTALVTFLEDDSDCKDPEKVCEKEIVIGTEENDRVEGDLVALINPYSSPSGLVGNGANVTITDNDQAARDTPPTARAGPSKVTEVDRTVRLDGSGSRDDLQPRDGIGLDYVWTVPDGVTLTLNEPANEGEPRGDKPTFYVSKDLAGQTLTITLVVKAQTEPLANGDKRESPPSTVLIEVRELVVVGNPDFKAQLDDQIWAVGEAVNLVLPQADIPDDPETPDVVENTFDDELDYYTYKVVPPLPEDVIFNATTRTITGAPTKVAARATYTYQAGRTVSCNPNNPRCRGATFAVHHSLEFDIVVTDGTPAVQVSVYDGPATVNEGVTVTLDGSASDPTGQALEDPVWSSSDVSLTVPDDGAKYRRTFVTPVLAADKVLTIALAVADAGGKQGTATVLVSVKHNQPPIVNAQVIGSPTVAEGVTVTLFGTASDPAGDDLKAPVWTSNDVSLTAFDGIEGPGLRSRFVAPVQLAVDKVLTITLTVEEVKAGGKSTQATVLVTVSAGPNDPPIVDAGPGQPRPQPGATVQLAGTASDPEKEDLTIVWTAPADVSLSDPNVLNPTFVAPTRLLGNNILTFTLTATEDLRGKSASDTLNITVVANIPPVAKAGRDETAMPGQTVTLGQAADKKDKPSATDEDQEDNTLDIAWTASGGGTLSNAGTLTPTFVVSDQIELSKELTLTLTVTDSKGAMHSDTMVISVTVNALPVVNAGANDIVAGGQTVELAGRATDPDGDNAALTYAWTTTSSDVNLSNAGTLTPTFVAPVVASDTELTLTLTATDIPGGSKSDKVTISVVAMPIVRSRTNGRIEEGEDASFDLRLPGLLYPADTPETLRTFTLEIRDAGQGNEALAADLNTSDLTVVFPVGQQVADFDVRTNDDTTGEPLEILTLGLGASTVTATVQIADNEPHLVTFMPSPVQIAEGGQQVVDIMLDRPYYDRIAGRSLSATAAFTSDGAAEVDDTTALDIMFSSNNLASAPVTFAEGDNSAQVTLVAVPDEIDEETETAKLVLSGTRVSTTGNSLDITITNTEPDQPELTLMPISTVTEGQTLTLTARLDRPPTKDLEVGIELLGGTAEVQSADFVDGNPFEKTLLTFTLPGSSSDACPNIGACVREIELGTVDDNRVEGNESVRVKLYAGDPFAPDATSNEATFVIADNERLHLSETSYSVEEGAALTVTAQLFIRKGSNEKTDDIFVARDIGVGLRLQPQTASAADFKANQFDQILETFVFADCTGSNIKVCEKAIVIQTLDNDVVGEDKQAVIELYSNPAGLVVNEANLAITEDDTVPNVPPTADAGLDREFGAGMQVTLTGKGDDPDGDNTMLTYAWERTGGNGFEFILSNSEKNSPTLTFNTDALNEGDPAVTHEFTLKVTDTDEAVAMDTVTITVNAPEPRDLSLAADSYTVTEGETLAVTVQLDGPPAQPIEVGIRRRSVGTSTSSADFVSSPFDKILVTFTPPSSSPNPCPSTGICKRTIEIEIAENDALEGDETFSFNLYTSASENLAVLSTPYIGNVTIKDKPPSNVAPTANAGPNQPAVPSGSQVTLDGSGSTDDGTIPDDGYAWTRDGGSGSSPVTLTNSLSSMPTFTADTLAPGDSPVTHEFSLVVTDNDGEPSTNQSTVTITVIAPGPQPNVAPTANAGVDQTVGEGETVTLNGSGDDPDGDNAALIFAWTSPTNVSLSSPSVPQPTFTAPVGLDNDLTLSFALVVTDVPGSASVPAMVQITVTADPDTDVTVPIEEDEQTVAERTETLKRGVGALGSEIGSSLAGAVSARSGLATPQSRLRLSGAAGSEASGLHPSSGTDFEPTQEYASVKDAVHGLQASQLLDKSEDGARFAGLWLQGDVNRFKDYSEQGARDGDIKSLHGGLDVRLTPQLLVGLGGSWHDGDFDYTGQAGISGKAEFEIASLYPYVNWDRDGMSAWAAVGLGSGELEVTEGDADRTSDLDHKLAAFGVGRHYELSERIDTVLRLEAFYSNLEVDASEEGQQTLDYDGFDTEVWQLRSQAEIGWTIVKREGLHLRPYAALGLLLEDGGERGIEQEVGLDLDTDDLHLRAEGRYHVLDEGSRVYGYSLSADYDSGDDSRGLLFALRAEQGRQRGFEEFDTNSSLQETHDANGRRTEAELGYGFWLGRGGLLKPYLVRRFASERKSLTFGLDYKLRALRMRLGFEQARSDTDQSGDDRFSIKARLEF